MSTKTQVALSRPQARTHRSFTPRVDLLASEDALLLLADLPGVSTDKLGIEVDRGVLQLTAIRSQGVRYQRALRLPEDIDVDGIEPTLKEGVLTLKLPRVQRAMPRTIEVSGG